MNRISGVHVSSLVAVFMILSSCGGESKGTTEPPLPDPGELTVQLTTPNADDGAIMLSISGLQNTTEIKASSGSYVSYSRQDGSTATVAVFGEIASGSLVHFAVPDLAAAATYHVTLREVADRSGAIRSLKNGYTISLGR